MAGLIPAIHVFFEAVSKARRGCPAQGLCSGRPEAGTRMGMTSNELRAA